MTTRTGRLLRVLVLAAMAATATLAAHAQTESADEKAIRALEDQERLAVLDGDIPAMERYWSERFIVNNPMGFVTPDRKTVVGLVRQGRISYASFERNIEAIRIHGDIAIVMGSETVVPKADAGTSKPPVQRRYTNVWQRSGGTWVNLARHANNVTKP